MLQINIGRYLHKIITNNYINVILLSYKKNNKKHTVRPVNLNVPIIITIHLPKHIKSYLMVR